MNLTPNVISDFRTKVHSYFSAHGRTFAWRQTFDPYAIIVSEIMLQQTQVDRVASKYDQFLTLFPTITDLANASCKDVLLAWQGLGYNRRGVALHQFAQRVVKEFAGNIPTDAKALQTFKGIGPYTSAAICAFAFNQPTVFIETNIRAVYLHTFFSGQEQVKDADLMALIELTLDRDNPRTWYYALMDYGTFIKKQYPNPNRKSAHYAVQSKFEGSDRQIRGLVIKMLTVSALPEAELIDLTRKEPGRVAKILDQLLAEKMIKKANNIYFI